MSLRALIVDDEALARARLRRFLREEPDVEIVGESANGREAVNAVTAHRPELLFLDVQMPGMNGFDVCTALAQGSPPPPRIIFVTAFDRYALQAFEVHALDYLLKPFDQERLRRALAHARDQLHRGGRDAADPRLAALLEALQAGGKKPDRLVFKEDGRIVFVRVANIDWIEADGNYVRVHAGAAAHYVRDTLARLEEQLPEETFVRISRSSIVNLDRVQALEPMFHGDYSVLLQGGHKLALGRHYRDRLDKFLGRGT